MGWLRIAHRGASGIAPEHTRPAFVRAIDVGVDMVELDVQLSRDEQLVVIHDDDLERTTSGRGLVRDHTWTQLRALDAGSWFSPEFAGERILTLAEVLSLNAGRVRLNVEIKAPEDQWEILVPALIDRLQKSGCIETTIISCFQYGALVAVRRAHAGVPIGVLWCSPQLEEAWRWCADLRACSLHPFWMLADRELVEKARANGLKVLAWTVNREEEMRSLLAVGIDGIMSDHPQRLMAVG